jgi:3-dehydroquinate dehydratase/shikimate dehydrogenase
MNRICLCLTGKSLEENVRSLQSYGGSVDLVELRADFLTEDELKAVKRFPALVRVPAILTIRRKKDGGTYEGSESGRIELLRGCVDGGYAYLDIEEDLPARSLEEPFCARGGRVIRSIHCLSGFESGLERRIRALKHRPSDLPKAAIQMETTRDLVRLLDLYENLADLEKILVGMGAISFPTRILAGLLGSYLTFTSMPDKEQAAEGHSDPATLCETYRYRDIGEQTQIFAVIGSPIMHSFSPHIHNRGFTLLGIDAVYLPFQVDEITDFLTLADRLHIQGASVTIPLKETVIPYLAVKTEGVEATGACNTILKREGGWYGVNTDVAGFLTPLERVLKLRALKNRRATVVGAGGAARSIVYALCREGFATLVLNRTAERARRLAQTFGCEGLPLDREGIEAVQDYRDLIVQTTSVGMHPDITADPLPTYSFRGDEIVYDIVYNPPLTRFLSRALEAGCRVIPGREMLISQAEHQFRLFTGRDYPDPEGIDLDL